MGRLERHLDPDAARRVAAGIKPHSQPEPLKRVRPRKLNEEYRGARRNASRGFLWDGMLANGYQSPVKSQSKYRAHQGEQEIWRRRRRIIQQQRAA